MTSSSSTNTSDGAKPSSCRRGHWRPGEDEKLKQLVNKYGAQKWKSIAEKLEGRSGRSDRLVSLVVCFLCLFSYLVLFLKEIKLVAPLYNVRTVLVLWPRSYASLNHIIQVLLSFSYSLIMPCSFSNELKD